MNTTDLLKAWSLPDRNGERCQLTVRVPYPVNAKLQALKAAYPARTINDLVSDLLASFLDAVIEALPSHVIDEDEAQFMSHQEGQDLSHMVGCTTGPRIAFDQAYVSLMRDQEAA